MRFEVPKYWLHPEGIFPAQIVTWEEADGKWGPRVKWVFETNQQRDDNKPAQLSFFTSCSFGKKSALSVMLTALGVAVPDTDEAAAAFNPDDLIGTECTIQVKHSLDNEGGMWANIEKIARKRPSQAVGTSAKAEPQRELVGAAVGPASDPFADQV